jgi:NADPH-dependent glutamate synthase beta subunit-like oxidoreductase
LLTQGNNAVFVAVGGWDSRLARTGGQGESSPVPGCHLLIDIMKAGSQGYPPVTLSGHVIIIGNPNMASTMVQRCKNLGAQKVTVLIRQTASTNLEVADAIVHGGICRFYGRDNRIESAELTDLGSGDVQTVQADHIVFAAGRIPELIFVPAADDDETTQTDVSGMGWEAFAPYKQPAFREEFGLMANGDELTDFSAAIKAIGAGRRAASSIHQTIYGIALDLPDMVITPDTPIQNVHQVSLVSVQSRQIMPASSKISIAKGAELEKGYTAAQAKDESKRCLQCGLICYLREPKEVEIEPAVATS